MVRAVEAAEQPCSYAVRHARSSVATLLLCSLIHDHTEQTGGFAARTAYTLGERRKKILPQENQSSKCRWVIPS